MKEHLLKIKDVGYEVCLIYEKNIDGWLCEVFNDKHILVLYSLNDDPENAVKDAYNRLELIKNK